MKVRIQRLIYGDPEDGVDAGWVVDLSGPHIEDTSSQWFAHEKDARSFAQRLSDLLINAPITQEEDDVI